ncbi:DUF1353 domain-containing protein [Spirosoma sp. HMF3257]|uniref:DUF1353 domain-containing protein n=1 Tax=Spirosoma telluris TaxID=2183553 RepID=A0A327NFQ9_9BACT|nr:DUF1353 domain-containing protein [Spirosoma telluris]RAI73997.1 hypothetical protein HMF3257_05795 [Spirosoma telluris]
MDQQERIVYLSAWQADLGSALFISLTDSFYCLPVVIDSRLEKPDQMAVLQDVLVELADHKLLLIPANFVTDCHSTPPWSQSTLPAYDNLTNLAAVAHDRLYMEWEEFANLYEDLKALGEIAARAYADGVYYELMERFKPGSFRNKLYYAAVRLFGWRNWRKFRKQPETG